MDNEQSQNPRKPSMEEASEAMVFKEQGNEYFKGKDYEEALRMYGLAIVIRMYTPGQGPHQLDLRVESGALPVQPGQVPGVAGGCRVGPQEGREKHQGALPGRRVARADLGGHQGQAHSG